MFVSDEVLFINFAISLYFSYAYVLSDFTKSYNLKIEVSSLYTCEILKLFNNLLCLFFYILIDWFQYSVNRKVKI